ncbi:MAG TPA: hypothetical protein VIU87_10300 [Mycobacterium sp.]
MAVTHALQQVPGLGLLATVARAVLGQTDQHCLFIPLQRSLGHVRGDRGQAQVPGSVRVAGQFDHRGAGLDGQVLV